MGDNLGDDWVAEGLNSGDEGISTTVAAAGKFLIDEIETCGEIRTPCDSVWERLWTTT